MKDIVGQAAKIIAESAKSPLGIVALMTLALSFLGYLFFAKSSDGVKVSIFCLMFFGFGLMAYNLVRRPSTLPRRVRTNDAVQKPRRIKDMSRRKNGIIR